jgi:hypothetical protein
MVFLISIPALLSSLVLAAHFFEAEKSARRKRHVKRLLAYFSYVPHGAAAEHFTPSRHFGFYSRAWPASHR